MTETLARTVASAGRSLFDLLLHPKSIAIIGASTNPEALGGRPLGFLTSYGYAGAVYPINANTDVVQGVPAYRSIRDVPGPVDLALVAVRAELVPGVLRDCAAAGVAVAAVISSGFGEGMGSGAKLAEVVNEIVATTGMRVIGPNCEGHASLPAAAPVTFSPVLDIRRTGRVLKPGEIAIISQSGGLGFAVAQWGTDVGLGYNYIITTGNELDVDCVELAEGLVDDPKTSALVLVLESVRDLAAFGALAGRFQDAGKKLIVAKLAVSQAGARAAIAHTTHIAGPADEYAAVFEKYGVHTADGMEQLIDLLQVLTKSPAARGNRVGVVTTSGGAGIWLTDTFAREGFTVPELSAETQQKLTAYMPSYGSPSNPVDLTAQFLAGGGSLVPAMQSLVDSGEVDLIVLATSLSSSGRLTSDRDALAAFIGSSPLPVAVHSYTRPAESCVEILNELNVPWYTDTVRTARGLAHLITREQR